MSTRPAELHQATRGAGPTHAKYAKVIWEHDLLQERLQLELHPKGQPSTHHRKLKSVVESSLAEAAEATFEFDSESQFGKGEWRVARPLVLSARLRPVRLNARF